MDQILETLFESHAKVRLLRLFMQNPERAFSLPDIALLTQVKRAHAVSIVGKFLKIGLVSQRLITVRPIMAPATPGSHAKPKKKRQSAKKIFVYQVNDAFSLFHELRDFILKSLSTSRIKLLQQIKRLGKIKLAIISGIFVNNENSRIDLLIVGDDIKGRAVEKFLIGLESELGKNVRYSIMDTDEFRYRLNMYDRFLRDVLETTHEKLLNKFHL